MPLMRLFVNATTTREKLKKYLSPSFQTGENSIWENVIFAARTERVWPYLELTIKSWGTLRFVQTAGKNFIAKTNLSAVLQAPAAPAPHADRNLLEGKVTELEDFRLLCNWTLVSFVFQRSYIYGRSFVMISCRLGFSANRSWQTLDFQHCNLSKVSVTALTIYIQFNTVQEDDTLKFWR